MFKELRAWWTVWFGEVPQAAKQADAAFHKEYSERLSKEREANSKALKLWEIEERKLLDDDLRSLADEIPWGMTGHDALVKVQRLRNDKRLIDLLIRQERATL